MKTTMVRHLTDPNEVFRQLSDPSNFSDKLTVPLKADLNPRDPTSVPQIVLIEVVVDDRVVGRTVSRSMDEPLLLPVDGIWDVCISYLKTKMDVEIFVMVGYDDGSYTTHTAKCAEDKATKGAEDPKHEPIDNGYSGEDVQSPNDER